MRVRCIRTPKNAHNVAARHVWSHMRGASLSARAQLLLKRATWLRVAPRAHAGWLAPRGVFEVGRGVEVMFPRGGGR